MSGHRGCGRRRTTPSAFSRGGGSRRTTRGTPPAQRQPSRQQHGSQARDTARNATDVDQNEITDKGYINQRAVLDHRASEVDRLFRATADDDAILLLTE